jgi:predicted TIM-barrel fold metal-dependent hydrolase
MEKIRCFDSHFHIIDDKFPLFSNQGYLPSRYTFEDYESQTRADPLLEITGGAVVSGSFHKFDQGYLFNALRTLNGSTDTRGFVGVAQLEAIDDKLCSELYAAGVRAARFNIARGVIPVANQSRDSRDSEGEYASLSRLSEHLFRTFGWHSEFYLDTKLLEVEGEGELLTAVLRNLPGPITIDHCGLSSSGSRALLELIRSRELGGKDTYVKLTGFGRFQGSAGELRALLQTLLRLHPTRLLFATDLPGTRAPRAFDRGDVELLLSCICDVYPPSSSSSSPSPSSARKVEVEVEVEVSEQRRVQALVFYENAVRLYRPNGDTHPPPRSHRARLG